MCSYTWCGFFEQRTQAQILPKSGEKSRHQPVFFYARAAAENGQSPALANGICVGTRCVFRVLRLKPALHAYFFLRAGGAEKPGRSSAQERFYERTFRTREEGFSRECFRAREDAILWKD